MKVIAATSDNELSRGAHDMFTLAVRREHLSSDGVLGRLLGLNDYSWPRRR
jgi:hypothetical protein